MKNFGPEGSLYAKVTLTDIPAESMVIATPFDKDKHFYYNQKINCMRAEGTVTYGYYNRTYTFDPADSFAVLDWGRGVWTYKNTWYWGSASGLVDGEPLRLQHRLRLRQHERREREHALLQGPRAQAQPGDLPHPR